MLKLVNNKNINIATILQSLLLLQCTDGEHVISTDHDLMIAQTIFTDVTTGDIRHQQCQAAVLSYD